MAKSSGGHLDSWKEIASYIRRNERTAMRWADHGMPVHRVPGSPRARVFAHAGEIDAWLAGATLPAENGEENHSAGPQPHADPPAVKPWARSVLVQTCFVGVLLGLVVGWLGWGAWRAHAKVPVSIEIRENRLIVSDHDHHVVWERSYDFPLNTHAYKEGETLPSQDFALLADIDADGSMETLFVPYPLGHPELLNQRCLSAFGQGGKLKWEYSRKKPIEFGGMVFDPPFPVQFFRIASLPGTKAKDIWVVSTHSRWFPSVVAKTNSQGQILGEYWHPGHVYVLAQARLFGRPVMLVGATNNETYSADLTVLDYVLPSGHGPASVGDYECTNCPPGRPIAFLAFPRTEISKVLNSRPRVREIYPLPDGGFEVAVDEGEVENAEPATVHYSLGSDLRLQDAQVTDAYITSFNKLLARGAVKHVLDRKAETDQLRHIRYWDGHGFQEQGAPVLVSAKK